MRINKKKFLITILVIFSASGLFFTFVTIPFYRNTFGKSFKVSGESMLPTFIEGQMIELTTCKESDRIFFVKEFLKFNKENDCTKNLERGDFVVFWEQQESKYLIKRIIAIPGDIVAIDSITPGDVYLNSKLLFEPYTFASHETYTSNTTYINNITNSIVKLEKGTYFIMGDNRKHSEDSRFFGPVKLESIVSYAKFLKYNKENQRYFVGP